MPAVSQLDQPPLAPETLGVEGDSLAGTPDLAAARLRFVSEHLGSTAAISDFAKTQAAGPLAMRQHGGVNLDTAPGVGLPQQARMKPALACFRCC